ncbi:MAG: kinase/pyrophosphorylase [Rhodospirillales bacterium]|jgi:[pyruvate, water dikinase]-phosphate phosphotransferase / [pyruvate, water dikinase] kinase|nr:kinase/pyrophosphorylase [Rhodospirillales bacterium]
MVRQKGIQNKTVNVHIVSDSTGETATSVARACLAQFDRVVWIEHIWPMVRKKTQLKEILAGIRKNPGIVIYTLVNREIQERLEEDCRQMQVPCVPVLDPVLEMMHSYLGAPGKPRPGRQHEMDSEYFARIEAVHFVLRHDDGKHPIDFDEADVVIAGVSRTLKTPTCIYLANRGIKAANIPIVPGVPIPPEVLKEGAPLVVGLTKDPKRLVQIRRNRLKMLNRDDDTDYADIDTVSEEVRTAREIFKAHKWPVIDVTRKSVEEVAATIMQLHKKRKDAQL